MNYAQKILDLPMQENDANARTVREYLKTLLFMLWERREGFSGKRPFGNSGWEHELYDALVAGGVLNGDEDGRILDSETGFADALIEAAIQGLA